jgi:hypothetical protein
MIRVAETFVVVAALILSYPISAQAAAEGGDDECALYMAFSSIPEAGLGLYTAQDLPEGSTVGDDYLDLYVPIKDKFKTLPYRGQQKFLSWLGYIWPERIDAFYPSYHDTVEPGMPRGRYSVDEGLNAANAFHYSDGNDNISAFSPGIASLVNSHPQLTNLYKHDPSDRVDPKDLQKTSSFSPYYGVSFKSTRDLEAGSELFINYGPRWHHRYDVKIDDGIEDEGVGEEHHFDDFPNEKEKRLLNLHDRRGTEETLRKLRSVKIKSNNDNKQGTVCEDDMDYDEESEGAEYFEYVEDYDEKDLDDDEYDECTREMNAIKEMDWLEENGMCVDHLRWGRSTIPDAGGGAFAKADNQWFCHCSSSIADNQEK